MLFDREAATLTQILKAQPKVEMTRQLLRENISSFELGKREPSLLVLLKYARVVNVWLDVLVDDELDLPDKLPSLDRSAGIKQSGSPHQGPDCY